MKPAFTFQKSERLCSKILISKLFDKGNRYLNRFPFRFSWILTPHSGEYPVQVLFVVSKRNFPKATSRNRIKRQIRELYRLHKHELYTALHDKKLILQIGFTGKNQMKYDEMELVFVQAFREMIKYVQKTD